MLIKFIEILKYQFFEFSIVSLLTRLYLCNIVTSSILIKTVNNKYLYHGLQYTTLHTYIHTYIFGQYNLSGKKGEN